MKISIFKLLIIITIAISSIFYVLFFINNMYQKEQSSKLIIKTIEDDLTELDLILSKYLIQNTMASSRVYLDQKIATNDYIKAIAILQGDKVLLSTSQKYKQSQSSRDSMHHMGEYNTGCHYDFIKRTTAISTEVTVNKDNKKSNYEIVFYIDKEATKDAITKSSNLFFSALVLIPTTFMLLAFLITKSMLVGPLKRLQSFLKTQNEVPSEMVILELDEVRKGLIHSFSKIENEKQDMHKMLRTDQLSGIANRTFLEEWFKEMEQYASKNSLPMALLFLDLDNFKTVNDSLGHNIGDELLRDVAMHIKRLLRKDDLVARIGGDEFVIVLADYQDDEKLVEILNRIQTSVISLSEKHDLITSSIGVALYPNDGSDLLTLMKNADMALNQSKQNGKNQYSFFSVSLNDKLQDFIKLSSDLKRGLTRNEFELYYQPQNKVDNNEVIGAEALIRWHHPTRGMVPPDIFIGIAEESGFIIGLGKWIIADAFRQKREWQDYGSAMHISINIGVKQLLEVNFVNYVTEMLEKYEIVAEEVHFEITEYIFLSSKKDTLQIFMDLKTTGIKISLDDFGTGYSSLSYLTNFPIDIVKIDKSFVNDGSRKGLNFLEAIIKMCEALELDVVAEGVETNVQLKCLQDNHCKSYQGYLVSKPVPAREFQKFLAK